MRPTPSAAELLVGTREELQRHMSELVATAGAAGNRIRFSPPFRWPGSESMYGVRVQVVDVAAPAPAAPPTWTSPAPRRRNLGPWIAGGVFLVLGLVVTAAALAVREVGRAAGGGMGRGAAVILAAIAFAALVVVEIRRRRSTTVTTVTYTRTRTR